MASEPPIEDKPLEERLVISLVPIAAGLLCLGLALKGRPVPGIRGLAALASVATAGILCFALPVWWLGVHRRFVGLDGPRVSIPAALVAFGLACLGFGLGAVAIEPRPLLFGIGALIAAIVLVSANGVVARPCKLLPEVTSELGLPKPSFGAHERPHSEGRLPGGVRASVVQSASRIVVELSGEWDETVTIEAQGVMHAVRSETVVTGDPEFDRAAFLAGAPGFLRARLDAAGREIVHAAVSRGVHVSGRTVHWSTSARDEILILPDQEALTAARRLAELLAAPRDERTALLEIVVRDPLATVRAETLRHVIARMRDHALAACTAALDDESPDVRRLAALFLVAPDSAPAPDVRARAAEILRALQESPGQVSLHDEGAAGALSDPDPSRTGALSIAKKHTDG